MYYILYIKYDISDTIYKMYYIYTQYLICKIDELIYKSYLKFYYLYKKSYKCLIDNWNKIATKY